MIFHNFVILFLQFLEIIIAKHLWSAFCMLGLSQEMSQWLGKSRNYYHSISQLRKLRQACGEMCPRFTGDEAMDLGFEPKQCGSRANMCNTQICFLVSKSPHVESPLWSPRGAGWMENDVTEERPGVPCGCWNTTAGARLDEMTSSGIFQMHVCLPSYFLTSFPHCAPAPSFLSDPQLCLHLFPQDSSMWGPQSFLTVFSL